MVIDKKIEPDMRFPEKEENKKSEKKSEEKVFGGKKHLKNMKYENRKKKLYTFFNRLKGSEGLAFRFSRFLDYVLNTFTLLALMCAVIFGIYGLLIKDYFTSLTAAVLIIVFTWLNEKII